jgi:hypothetical protein
LSGAGVDNLSFRGWAWAGKACGESGGCKNEEHGEITPRKPSSIPKFYGRAGLNTGRSVLKIDPARPPFNRLLIQAKGRLVDLMLGDLASSDAVEASCRRPPLSMTLVVAPQKPGGRDARESNCCRFRLDRDGHALERDETLWFAAGASQAAQVGLHFTIRFEGNEHSIEDRNCCCIPRTFDTVVHPLSFSPGRHYACLSQICEVPRDLGLALPQYFNQIANAHLAARD